jgi:hypothetical protein
MGKAMVQREYRELLGRYWRAVGERERQGRQAPRFLGGQWPDGDRYRSGWKDTWNGDILWKREEVEERKTAA